MLTVPDQKKIKQYPGGKMEWTNEPFFAIKIQSHFKGILFDDTGAYKLVVFIPCDKLARGDALLRTIENNIQPVLFFKEGALC